jgi:hypothetical protein
MRLMGATADRKRISRYQSFRDGDFTGGIWREAEELYRFSEG